MHEDHAKPVKFQSNSIIILQFHGQCLPEENKEVPVNADVLMHKCKADKAEMLAAIAGVCKDGMLFLLQCIFITHGGDEVLPVRHPRDHVDHGPRHHPGHHVARRPDCAEFL